MRPIDADALREDLIHNRSFYPVIVKHAIEDAPTIDATPIVRGYWEKLKGLFTPGGDPLYRCPICKSEESEHFHGVERYSNRHYCPTCGARLEYKP